MSSFDQTRCNAIQGLIPTNEVERKEDTLNLSLSNQAKYNQARYNQARYTKLTQTQILIALLATITVQDSAECTA